MSAAIEQRTELEALRERKQQLALDVISNVKGSKSELTAVVRQIAEHEQEAELLELAEKEKQRRDAEAEQQRQAAEREKGEAELVTLKAERDKTQQLFTNRLTGLVEALTAHYWAARRVYGKESELGQNPRWRVLDNMSREIRTAVGHLLKWDGLEYVSVPYRTVGGLMAGPPVEELQTCAACGSATATGATHNCAMTGCERCHAVYDKHTSHKCDVNAILSAPEPAREASIPLIVASATDTHVVAKQFEGPGGRVYQQGEPVDASEWRNVEALVATHYLRVIDRADKPILEPPSELATGGTGMSTSEAMNLFGAAGVISDHPCIDARAARLVLFCYACGCNVDALKDFHDCPVAGPGLPTWWGETTRAWVVC